MPDTLERNLVARYFGTPTVTEGSVNEPREREEHGVRFNEKWIYRHPKHDPVEAIERIIYWRRYDYVGSRIRRSPDGPLEDDPHLLLNLQDHSST
jgi:hypothetical protein